MRVVHHQSRHVSAPRDFDDSSYVECCRNDRANNNIMRTITAVRPTGLRLNLVDRVEQRPIYPLDNCNDLLPVNAGLVGRTTTNAINFALNALE